VLPSQKEKLWHTNDELIDRFNDNDTHLKWRIASPQPQKSRLLNFNFEADKNQIKKKLKKNN